MTGRDAALTALMLAALAAALVWLNRVETVDGPMRVVDGDTLAVGSRRLRLRGIDAPELAQTCTQDGRPYPCGTLARDALRALTHGGAVRCTIDGRDKFGRGLAVCRSSGRDVGEAMVAGGWAVAFGRYADAEAVARTGRVGIWAGPFDRPADWRRDHPRSPAHDAAF